MPKARRLLLMLVLCVGFAGSQDSLRGVVTDATGASVPKARILLVNLHSLDTWRSEVPANGTFAFSNLEAGEYVVVVAGPSDPHAPCWKATIRQVQIDKQSAPDLQLRLMLDATKCPGIID